MESPTPPDSLLPFLEYPAAVVGADYRIRAANPLCIALFHRDSTLVGRRCYEAFHSLAEPCDRAGELCPVKRYRETGEPLRTVHLHRTCFGERHHDVLVYPAEDHNGGPTLFVGILRPITIASARACRHALVGRSPAFLRLLELLLRVAPRETAVLLLGESGTGKEQIARAIHRTSPRARHGFAALSCAGMRTSQFTGELLKALSQAAGSVPPDPETDAALRPGTLYLGEIGELPREAQGELLRLLKRRARSGRGGADSGPFEFRLISAAEPDLPERVQRGEFSAELYYRIGTFPIPVPSLRERMDDLPLLAATLLLDVGCCPSAELAPATVAVLRCYSFPGNLGELRRVLERACVRSGNGVIQPEHLPVELLEPAI